MKFGLLATAIAFAVGAAPAQAETPIFDAHIHYSHDAWDMLPPEAAVKALRDAGVTRAFVSSSGMDGAQSLFAIAPDLIAPVLRPYRRRGEIGSWIDDPTAADYVEGQLAKHRYAGIGEFHVYGADADKPVVRRIVQMAKDHKIFLHAHSDADAVERIFAQDPDARVIWAHSGFDNPEAVTALLARHKNLWADLAFRSEHGAGGKVDPEWRRAFLAFPDRFMVGTDTFAPERWFYVAEHAAWSRTWLADLPADVAAKIGHANAKALAAWSFDD